MSQFPSSMLTPQVTNSEANSDAKVLKRAQWTSLVGVGSSSLSGCLPADAIMPPKASRCDSGDGVGAQGTHFYGAHRRHNRSHAPCVDSYVAILFAHWLHAWASVRTDVPSAPVAHVVSQPRCGVPARAATVPVEGKVSPLGM